MIRNKTKYKTEIKKYYMTWICSQVKSLTLYKYIYIF